MKHLKIPVSYYKKITGYEPVIFSVHFPCTFRAKKLVSYELIGNQKAPESLNSGAFLAHASLYACLYQCS